MVLIFFCIFILTEERGSPCYQTLEQYQVAGLGMVMMFFPLLSTNYQSRRVFKIWNHTKLIDLVWYYCFSAFLNLTEQWESLYYETLKQYQIAGLCMLLIFIFLFCHPTIRVAVLSEFEKISSCWTWYGTDFFLHFYSHWTKRVALLSDTRTISSCWTWYGNDVFSFIVNKLSESPCL